MERHCKKIKVKDINFKLDYNSSNINEFKHKNFGNVRFYGVDKVDDITFLSLYSYMDNMFSVSDVLELKELINRVIKIK